MKVESLIFDMDGTLWDSAEKVAESWTAVLKEQPDVDMVVTEADIKAISDSMEENCMMALRIR